MTTTATHTLAFDGPVDEARRALVGQPLSAVRTPALIIDRATVQRNCARMQRIAASFGAPLRPHLKTHKTLEGARMQLQTHDGSSTSAIVSTMAELRGAIDGLVGKDAGFALKNLCYGLPITADKIAELVELRHQGRQLDPEFDLVLIVDQPAQVRTLQAHLAKSDAEASAPFSVFFKVETGDVRAGVLPGSAIFHAITEAIVASPNVSLYGVYGHAGHSYDARGVEQAVEYLKQELSAVNRAGELLNLALAQGSGGSASRHRSPLLLSVGATPTAGAAAAGTVKEMLATLSQQPHGDFELHAGNYAFLDMQQLATRVQNEAASVEDLAMSVLATVVSEYPQRAAEDVGQIGQWSADGYAKRGDEALCDAGGIAMSKDQGPWPGYGHVVWPRHQIGWMLSRPSQEHGILEVRPGTKDDWTSMWTWRGADGFVEPRPLLVGDRIRILPQHACLAAANHFYYYIIDSDQGGETVVDVWKPWKGW
ncbi:uncharacterized protein PSFLO_04088 [Pseudozyma flocculosa]|uniref:D-serine dehydratase-like domain-containing protein n=1 Tax=Pseudozyma flocculosa TaxID=84751 RepID=A0A5C3F3D5_9BASI|nr:uncharacterized protein PSFLO_04088 [Pseudozyma flocculosa]